MIKGIEKKNAVEIDGRPLDPRESQALANHSPDGFCWGYEGSGPAQLALALLLYFSDRQSALQHYQAFKREVVAHLSDDFTLSKERVREWLELRSVKTRPEYLERFCDQHLREKQAQPNRETDYYHCADCFDGAPVFIDRCREKKCGRGIPQGAGFYNFGGDAIYCESCGDKKPQVPEFSL